MPPPPPGGGEQGEREGRQGRHQRRCRGLLGSLADRPTDPSPPTPHSSGSRPLLKAGSLLPAPTPVEEDPFRGPTIGGGCGGSRAPPI